MALTESRYLRPIFEFSFIGMAIVALRLRVAE
jgi:hypothetical protein